MTRSSERLPGLAWLFARILRRAARTPGWVTLWTAIAEHRRLLRTTLLAVFVWAGLKVLGPQLLAGVLEEGASSRTLVALFVAAGLVTAVLTSVRRRLVHLLSRRVERSLLVSVHDHGTALVRGGANPSDVVAYSGDPGRTQLFVQLVPIVAANLLQLLAAAAFMVGVSPVLAAATAVPLVLGWRLYVRQARALEKPSARARDAQGRMLGLFDEHVTNDNVIRGFGLRDRHAGAFLDAGAITEERNLAVSRTKSFYGPATDTVVTSTAIFVVLVGGNLAIAGLVSLADLLLFQLYASMLLWPLRNLGALIASSVSACEAAGRVALLGSRVQGRPEPTTMPAPGWHSILADSPELPGELEGAYAVSGRSPGVFAGSIRENVAMGSVHEIDDRDVEEYCRAVGLDGEIRLRTGGYDSDPGEGGKLLSGGQRQRLALARALAADPGVLVLESALDAVDATTAAEALEEVRRRRGSRSTFLLTSDSEQVRDTDAVLDRRDRRASGHSVSAAGRPVPPDHCPAPETIRRTGPSAEPAVGPAVGPAVEDVIPAMRDPLDDAPHLPSTWGDVLRGLPPGRALAAAFGVLAAGAFTSLIAVLQGRAVDQGVVAGDRATLLFCVAGQFAAAAGAFAVSLFHARSLGVLGERLIRKLRRSVLLVLGRRDVSFYDRDGTGTILSRITSDAEAVKGAVCGSSLPLLSYTALAAGALGMAAVTYPQYLPVVVPCVLLLVLAGISFLRTSAKMYPEVQQATAEVLAALRENLSCARVLRHGDPRGTRVKLFKGKVDRYVETQVRVVDVTNLFASCVEGLGVVATGLVAYLWLESATGPGALFVLFGLFASVFEPLQNAIQSYGSVRPGRVALGRLHEGLGAESDEAAAQPVRVALPAGTATVAAGVPANASASGAAPLVYQAIGVGFFFGSLPVLRGVDLEVVEGERLAVVGRSGCGKSTLLALLAGVRRPSSGGVLYRGEATIPLGREVLWVPQEVRPFGGTVRENLAMMLGGVGTDDLVDRLWASSLGEVLVPLLEVPAAALSIPEARLLVYAGAALRRPDVLLLDEPTSGMGDVEREVLIESLRALGRGSTVVLVTHSPSLAAACDRVVSLREGVVEKLPH